MTRHEARRVVLAHYGVSHPERRETRRTPRGFWLSAARGFRTLAANLRSDSPQHDVVQWERLAAAAERLARG